MTLSSDVVTVWFWFIGAACRSRAVEGNEEIAVCLVNCKGHGRKWLFHSNMEENHDNLRIAAEIRSRNIANVSRHCCYQGCYIWVDFGTQWYAACHTVRDRLKKWSEYVHYFVFNNLWQTQSVSFLNIITFSPLTICSCSQAFWSHLRRNFSAVIEATDVPRAWLHHWQILCERLLSVVQTCDNPMELGLDQMGNVREVQV